MLESRLELKSKGGHLLVGLEDRPDVIPSPLPAMIFVHGFYGNKDERGMFAELARAFVDEGIIVYRFDLTGCGESGGDYGAVSMATLASDVRTIADAAKRQSFVDPNRLGFLGFSLGASTVLALRPVDAQCLVLLGAVAHPSKILEPLFSSGFHPSWLTRRLSAIGARVAMQRSFWASLESLDCIGTLRSWNVPLFLVHNQDDTLVPVREGEALFDAAIGQKQKVILPEQGHTIRDHAVLRQVAVWCREQFEKESPSAM